MAGIGFELRKILKKDTLLSIVEAYGIAAVISSGPWVLSIFALLIIGFFSVGWIYPTYIVEQFLILVTYLMAASLIISGLFQLMLTRFISDLIFEEKEHEIVPNLLGTMLCTTLIAGLLGLTVACFLTEVTALVKVILVLALVLLCNLWLILVFLSGMKEYYRIFLTMLLCYGLMVFLCFLMPDLGLLGLLTVFTVSQAILTFSLLYYVVRDFPARELVVFDFLSRKKVFYSLLFCGFFYNLGVWLDKFVFWYRAETSQQIIDFFRASYIYDLPIFIAYLAVVPGMAVFMLRMETDFALACEKFYQAVRDSGTLQSIYSLKENMVLACRESIYEIFKVQGMALVLLLIWAEDILILLDIDVAYLPLLYVDLIGVSFQVMVMAILNVMYYLDKRYSALALTVFMAAGNFFLAHLTIDMGPIYYGYGFAVTMITTSLIGLIALNHQFNTLEYHTFMLQRS